MSLSRLGHRDIPTAVVETLIEAGVEDKNFLKDREKMTRLRERLDSRGYVSDDIVWHEERELFEIFIVKMKSDQFHDGQDRQLDDPIKIGRGLIYSRDYQKSLSLAKRIEQYNRPPFTVVSNENEKNALVIEDRRSLINHLIEEGKKGMGVQRYKGLGR